MWLSSSIRDKKAGIHIPTSPAGIEWLTYFNVVGMAEKKRWKHNLITSTDASGRIRTSNQAIHGLEVGVGVTGVATLILMYTGSLKLLRFSLDITQTLL